MKTKEENLVESARKIAASVETWADLSNALFDPEDGLVARAYQTRQEREKFLKMKEYRAIRQLIETTRTRTGLVEGASPKKSGKFIVHLPCSLHAALEAEARREGVSLNQLVVTKLAVQLSQIASTPAASPARPQ